MNNNRCICCGEIIPEGRQICPICEKGKYLHKQLIFICSPFHSDDKVRQNINLENAKTYCRLAYGQGYIPIAPHLLFPQFLNDDNKIERENGIKMSKQLLLKCSEIWVCGDYITNGMEQEISFANENHIPVKRIKHCVYTLIKGGTFI